MNLQEVISKDLNHGWWINWIKHSIPGFYSFWASRLATGYVNEKTGKFVDYDNPELLLEKFENLLKYNNAVGLLMFREENGKYVPAEGERINRAKLSIDNAIDDLIKFLDSHLC